MTNYVERFLAEATRTIADHADELTALDQAIGDGDHGINMKRGFGAVAEIEEEIAGLDFGPAFQKIGMTLVMKVGGASGPLYGSLFMAMGKAIPAAPQSLDDAVAVASQGVEAVKKRGKSNAGEKTMLDVLVPALETLSNAAKQGASVEEARAAVRASAAEGLEATREMRAAKGRASFLGERSIGHLDPGARSSVLLIEAACTALSGG